MHPEHIEDTHSITNPTGSELIAHLEITANSETELEGEESAGSIGELLDAWVSNFVCYHTTLL